jgi:hypothetical protein
MWSLLEFFPIGSQINILDVGAALLERPPYQSLIDAGVGRLFGFEPDPQACARLNEEYGEPHRFFQCFAGDGARQHFTRQMGARPALFMRPTRGCLKNSRI